MKIEFHYMYLIIALSFILTGFFSNILVFTSIIIVHEMGHYIIAKLNNLKVEKIIIYPYGGLTKMNVPINTKIRTDLYVAVAGISFQLIYYLIIYILYRNNMIREYIFRQFMMYNQSILLFNLLPIHPLDGSKILNLLMAKVFPYKVTLKLNVIISIVTLIVLIMVNYYQFNYTVILIMTVIVDSVYKYYKEINYYFNKFLLERYLYENKYKDMKKIDKIEKMYKEKTHVIRENNHYITEKQALNHRFQGKY